MECDFCKKKFEEEALIKVNGMTFCSDCASDALSEASTEEEINKISNAIEDFSIRIDEDESDISFEEVYCSSCNEPKSECGELIDGYCIRCLRKVHGIKEN